MQLLRNSLALDRTRLANERTLLAYVRTALAVLATGLGFTYLFPSVWGSATGWGLGVVSLGLVAWGIARYRAVSRDLQRAREVDQPLGD